MLTLSPLALLVSLRAVGAPVGRVLSITPQAGPATGGTLLTVSGAGFTGGTQHQCRFAYGDEVVSATFSGRSSHGVLTCSTPPAEAGYQVAVEISLDGGVRFSHSGFRFSYYHEAVVSAVTPSAGPAVGGTAVSVHGSNFAPRPGLQCSFGWRRAAATFVNYELIRCVAPTHSANGTLAASFDNGLELSLDDGEVQGRLGLAGSSRVADGVLTLAWRPPAAQGGPPAHTSLPPPPPYSPASPASLLGSPHSASAAVAPGCGMLSIEVGGDTHTPSRGFSASFEVLMDGEATRGVAFSFGELSTPAPSPPASSPADPTPSTPRAAQTRAPGTTGRVPPPPPPAAANFTELGAPRGLAVRLLANSPAHFRPLTAEIAMDGKVLAATVLGRGALLRGAWAPVSIRLDPVSSELRLNHDGRHRLSVVLANWQPAAHWQFALTGCVSQAGAEGSTGSAAGASTNGTAGSEGSGSTDGLGLAGGLPNGSSNASFGGGGGGGSSGGVGGGVVLVDNLQVGGTAIFVEKQIDVRVSLNSLSFSPSAARFDFYAPPTVSSVRPSSGPAFGGTLVTIGGAHLSKGALGANRQCLFGQHLVEGTLSISDGAPSILCRTPTLQAGMVYATEVSLNGVDFTSSGTPSAAPVYALGSTPAGVGHFVAYGVPQVSSASPSLGPMRGGTLISLRGVNFDGGSDYRCLFGANATSAPSVPASFNGAMRAIECYTPTLQLGRHAVLVSLNGQSYSSAEPTAPASIAVTFVALPPPAITSITTAALLENSTVKGPYWGGSMVTLEGEGFEFGGALPGLQRCRFGAAIVAATVVDASRVLCAQVPSAVKAGANFTYGPASFSDGLIQPPLVASGDAVGVPYAWSVARGSSTGGFLRLSPAGRGALSPQLRNPACLNHPPCLLITLGRSRLTWPSAHAFVRARLPIPLVCLSHPSSYLARLPSHPFPVPTPFPCTPPSRAHPLLVPTRHTFCAGRRRWRGLRCPGASRAVRRYGLYATAGRLRLLCPLSFSSALRALLLHRLPPAARLQLRLQLQLWAPRVGAHRRVGSGERASGALETGSSHPARGASVEAVGDGTAAGCAPRLLPNPDPGLTQPGAVGQPRWRHPPRPHPAGGLASHIGLEVWVRFAREHACGGWPY